jgi:hypothetical protein
MWQRLHNLNVPIHNDNPTYRQVLAEADLQIPWRNRSLHGICVDERHTGNCHFPLLCARISSLFPLRFAHAASFQERLYLVSARSAPPETKRHREAKALQRSEECPTPGSAHRVSVLPTGKPHSCRELYCRGLEMRTPPVSLPAIGQEYLSLQYEYERPHRVRQPSWSWSQRYGPTVGSGEEGGGGGPRRSGAEPRGAGAAFHRRSATPGIRVGFHSPYVHWVSYPCAASANG